MQTEDDDIPINSSPPDSQTSSIEGVYPTPSKTTHPFRIIEHDTLSLQSMTSLGRVGRILAGVADNASGVLVSGISQCPPPAALTREGQVSSVASIPSKDEDTTSGKVSQSSSILTLSGDVPQESSVNGRSNYASHSQSDKIVTLQEPDVIASTKNNGKSMEDITAMPGVPVAPPRRKKRTKTSTPSDLAVRFIAIILSIGADRDNIRHADFNLFHAISAFRGDARSRFAASESSEHHRIDNQRIRAFPRYPIRDEGPIRR